MEVFFAHRHEVGAPRYREAPAGTTLYKVWAAAFQLGVIETVGGVPRVYTGGPVRFYSVLDESHDWERCHVVTITVPLPIHTCSDLDLEAMVLQEVDNKLRGARGLVDMIWQSGKEDSWDMFSGTCDLVQTQGDLDGQPTEPPEPGKSLLARAMARLRRKK